MSEKFIPLGPAAVAGNQRAAVSEVRILTGAQTASAVRWSDHAHVPKASAAPVPAFAPLGAARPESAAGAQPRIELQREGDRITLIRVHCACGQIIELACGY